MKFALSTPTSPTADLQALALRAKEIGYDGIELGTPPAGGALRSADVEIACIASPLGMPRGRRARGAAAEELRGLIDAAGQLGCKRVRIPGAQVPAGESAGSVAVQMGNWLLPLADYAAERGVTILVQNAQSFRKSRDLWMLLESINHPNVAACWDLTAGVAAGEGPLVSVPTLNTRMQYVLVGDADEAAERFLTRLRGIGYTGYVAVQVSDALPKLREWGTAPVAKAAAKVAKPVAPKGAVAAPLK